MWYVYISLVVSAIVLMYNPYTLEDAKKDPEIGGVLGAFTTISYLGVCFAMGFIWPFILGTVIKAVLHEIF